MLNEKVEFHQRLEPEDVSLAVSGVVQPEIVSELHSVEVDIFAFEQVESVFGHQLQASSRPENIASPPAGENPATQDIAHTEPTLDKSGFSLPDPDMNIDGALHRVEVLGIDVHHCKQPRLVEVPLGFDQFTEPADVTRFEGDLLLDDRVLGQYVPRHLHVTNRDLGAGYHVELDRGHVAADLDGFVYRYGEIPLVEILRLERIDVGGQIRRVVRLAGFEEQTLAQVVFVDQRVRRKADHPDHGRLAFLDEDVDVDEAAVVGVFQPIELDGGLEKPGRVVVTLQTGDVPGKDPVVNTGLVENVVPGRSARFHLPFEIIPGNVFVAGKYNLVDEGVLAVRRLVVHIGAGGGGNYDQGGGEGDNPGRGRPGILDSPPECAIPNELSTLVREVATIVLP